MDDRSIELMADNYLTAKSIITSQLPVVFYPQSIISLLIFLQFLVFLSLSLSLDTHVSQ